MDKIDKEIIDPETFKTNSDILTKYFVLSGILLAKMMDVPEFSDDCTEATLKTTTLFRNCLNEIASGTRKNDDPELVDLVFNHHIHSMHQMLRAAYPDDKELCDLVTSVLNV